MIVNHDLGPVIETSGGVHSSSSSSSAIASEIMDRWGSTNSNNRPRMVIEWKSIGITSRLQEREKTANATQWVDMDAHEPTTQ